MPKKEIIVSKSNVDALERYDDVFEIHSPKEIIDYTIDNQFITFRAGNEMLIMLHFVSESIIRVRYGLNGNFERDFSYAIACEKILQDVDFEIVSEPEKFIINSIKMNIEILKSNGLITLFDKNQQIICTDDAPFQATSTLLKGITDVKITKKIAENESFWGLGDKSWNLNLKGKQFENWCTDAFGFSKNSDPLYRAIPFYISLNNTIAHGLFLDNPYRSTFDFGSKNNAALEISTDGGEMNYYFIIGENAIDIAQKYTQLTGTPELPPMWALGFHQCRWSYYPDSRVREIAKEFREKQIPCDAIYLDIDYMDGYRCFTINNTYFPDLKQLTKEIQDEGFEAVVMIDPGIRVDNDYDVYRSGLEKDMFCRRFSGELMVGPVWPPACVFPDFTDPKVRNWWGELYQDFYENQGISGFWNDMNEPAVFNVKRMTFPNEVRHDYDGQPTDHRKAHNIYGMQMSRATYEGLKKIKPKKRPFLLTRASFSGGQRYAAVWTGDNFATWEHLRLANIQAQRLCLSGFSFCGSDIGGFAETPSGELMVRWLQLAVFHPVIRIHSMGNHEDGAATVDEETVKKAESKDRLDQEPWAFGDAFTPFAKAAIELRYQLLPYLYTTFYDYSVQGTPIIKSAALLSSKFLNHERDFLFGENIWVSPIEKRGVKKQLIDFPEGEWFYYFDNKKYEKNAELKTNLASILLFIKAGTVLPIAPVRQHTKEKITTMELRVYYSENITTSISKLYEDAGEGYGETLLRTFTLEKNGQKLKLYQERNGKYSVDYQYFTIRLIGIGEDNFFEINQDFEMIELL